MKSFERLPGTLSVDEIGRFLCLGGKISSENKDERMQGIHLPRIVHCLGKEEHENFHHKCCQ